MSHSPHDSKIIQALIAAFAGDGIFERFERECGKWSHSLERIYQTAHTAGAISAPTREQFMEFISSQMPSAESCSCRTFEQCIDALRGTLSVKGLLDKINREAETLGLPAIQAPQISRFKEFFSLTTPRQRSAVHVIAFWAGKQRPETGISFNSLCGLASSEAMAPQRQSIRPHGVVLAISLQSKGGLVTSESIEWVRNQLSGSIHDLRLHYLSSPRAVESLSASAVVLKIEERQSSGTDMRAYGQAIRDCLALAHQMAVYWRLSPHFEPHVGMVIVIDVGDFNQSISTISHILDFRHSINPAIVLSDLAYLCARVADVKVGFAAYDGCSQQDNGNIGRLWSASYFWTHTYHDYVAGLLTEEVIPLSNTSEDYFAFRRDLFSFNHAAPPSLFSAIKVVYTYPVSDIVHLEIAKVCLARCMFREADHILSFVLINNPHHAVARVMRILVYLNLGMHATTVESADRAIERAISEGEFLRNLSPEDPEVWCEIGLIYFWNSFRRAAGALRSGNTLNGDVDRWLDEAHTCFSKGGVVSSCGIDNRCIFWLLYTEALQELFAGYDHTDLHSGITDSKGVFIRCSARFFSSVGWIDQMCTKRAETETDVLDIMAEKDILNLIGILQSHIAVYGNAALSRSYVPNILFAFCCTLWDFLPNLTADLCRTLLDWLGQSRALTELCKKDNLAIFSCTNCFSLYQPPDEFISCIDATIREVNAHLPRGFAKKGCFEMLSRSAARKRLSLKLLLMHNNVLLDQTGNVKKSF